MPAFQVDSEQLESCLFIDNHAHSIRRRFLELDALEFRRCFSESSSLALLEKHWPGSIPYQHAISSLASVVPHSGESSFLEARQAFKTADFVNLLFDSASFGSLLIDDGFASGDVFSVEELASLCQRPLFRILRVETLAESLLFESPTFAELIDSMANRIVAAAGALDGRARVVGLKTIAAYRGGLDIEAVNEESARRDYEQWQVERGSDRSSPVRLFRRPFYHYMLASTFELAGELGLPVQVHCGFGYLILDTRSLIPDS